jgi:hypothetical protein
MFFNAIRMCADIGVNMEVVMLLSFVGEEQ